MGILDHFDCAGDDRKHYKKNKQLQVRSLTFPNRLFHVCKKTEHKTVFDLHHVSHFPCLTNSNLPNTDGSINDV